MWYRLIKKKIICTDSLEKLLFEFVAFVDLMHLKHIIFIISSFGDVIYHYYDYISSAINITLILDEH